MKHLEFSPTPVVSLNYYSTKWNNNLLCKRDDIFEKAYGGSKARMLQYILYPILREGTDVILTAGGPCSNFNRTIALLCAEYKLHLKLVSYTDNDKEYKESLNHYLVNLSGAEFIFCKKNEVKDVISNTIDSLIKENVRFKYVYGGGRSLEGLYSYFDAVKELKCQGVEKLDEVYVACGTGTTLSGICAGMQEYFPKTIVHGISIARNREQEWPILEENMRNISNFLNKEYTLDNLVFHDEFLYGGYNNSSAKQMSVIKECIEKQGLIIDPTYSGKAFWGMSELLGNIESKGKNILFWNTGGIFNLLSYHNSFQF